MTLGYVVGTGNLGRMSMLFEGLSSNLAKFKGYLKILLLVDNPVYVGEL
jgi:hypothetical protein